MAWDGGGKHFPERGERSAVRGEVTGGGNNDSPIGGGGRFVFSLELKAIWGEKIMTQTKRCPGHLLEG